MKNLSLLSFLLLFRLLTYGQADPYFQQEVNYKIDVKLNDKAHSLSAFEEFEYINNSPDELQILMIHLWPNAYKNAKTAMAKQKFRQGDYFMLYAKEGAKGHIDSLDFKVDGQPATWEYYENYEDIAVLHLPTPLKPGGKITVSTPFFVKLPSGSISRLGHVGESYQITQWYPKPAVYDREGWHAMPYLTQGEFFSEFGSFDVSITLPENYTVAATGDLQTQSEKERLDMLSALPVIPVQDAAFPPSSASTKTLRYIQKNVHDFGWFADKRWVVRKGEVELPHSKRRVTTWALFTPGNSAIWDKAGIKAINDGLYYYSLWSGDYPYDVCTAVDGTISAGGGMEYPNVTVIGNTGSEQELATVIIHEVGHNWFYGILGSNERDNAWMDEGINSFFETRTVLATAKDPGSLNISVGGIDGGKLLGLDKFSYQYLTEEVPYLYTARTNKDQPIQAPSDAYTNLNYGAIVYKKTSLAFTYLMNYLGEDLFNQCMANYFEAWKFKHPSPRDIRAVFEQTSGKDLSWFFDEIIDTKNAVDYKAASVSRSKAGYRLRVKNDGKVSGPYSVDIIRGETLVKRQWFDPIVHGKSQVVELDARKGDVIKLNNVTGIPEFNRNNNTIKTQGLFRKTEPYKLKLLTGVDDPETSQLFWNPLVAYNNYNNWMLGIQLHNQTIPSKNYSWSIAPLYSISKNDLNGFAKIEYDNGLFFAGVKGQKFRSADVAQPVSYHDFHGYKAEDYFFIKPYIGLDLFTNRIKKDWSGAITVFGYYINQNYPVPKVIYTSDYSIDVLKYRRYDSAHLRFKLDLKKKMLRSEVRFQTMVEMGDISDWTPFQQSTLSYDYVYRGKGKRKIRTRLYYAACDHAIKLNAAGQNGPNDYLYDGLFIGRTETTGILSQQFLRTQGGLAVPTNMGANRNMVTLNVEIDAPVKLPVSFYGGFGVLTNNPSYHLDDNNEWVSNDPQTVLWNAGVSIPLIRNIFQVYMPIFYSQNIRDEFKARNMNFGETIMFELNLNMANPFELLKKIEF